MGPIKFTVKDSDTLASDDVLGYCDVDWNCCVKDAGSWAYNTVAEL